jgi:hypothetical protein
VPACNFERDIGRRVASRTRCDLVVDIRDGARTMRALLSDFSATGFKLGHVRGELAGSSLWLCPDGMEPLAAKVRWNRGGAMGCQFLYPLSDAAEAALKVLVAASRAPLPGATAPQPLAMEAAL